MGAIWHILSSKDLRDAGSSSLSAVGGGYKFVVDAVSESVECVETMSSLVFSFGFRVLRV